MFERRKEALIKKTDNELNKLAEVPTADEKTRLRNSIYDAFRQIWHDAEFEWPTVSREHLEPLASHLCGTMATNFAINIQERVFQHQRKVVSYQLGGVLGLNGGENDNDDIKNDNDDDDDDDDSSSDTDEEEEGFDNAWGPSPTSCKPAALADAGHVPCPLLTPEPRAQPPPPDPLAEGAEGSEIDSTPDDGNDSGDRDSDDGVDPAAMTKKKKKELRRKLLVYFVNELNGFGQDRATGDLDTVFNSDAVQQIFQAHTARLPPPNAVARPFSKARVGKKPAQFVPYMNYLNSVCFGTHDNDGKKLAGFAVLPFRVLKPCMIPVSENTINSLLRLGGASADDADLASKLQTKADADNDMDLLRRYFPGIIEPRQRGLVHRLKDRGRFYVMIDGVSARVHAFRANGDHPADEDEPESPVKLVGAYQDSPGECVPVSQDKMLARRYGNHPTAGYSQFPTGTILADDPSGRSPRGRLPSSPPWIRDTLRSRRLSTKARRLRKEIFHLFREDCPSARRKRLLAGVSVYQLSNRQYQKMTQLYSTRARAYHRAQRLGRELTNAHDALVANPTHKPTVEGAVAHARVYLQHWEVLKKRTFHRDVRYDRLNRFRHRQCAASKIAKYIRASVRTVEAPETRLHGQVVLVWGNGSFGPTSRGHAAAPNKSLRKQLSAHFPIVLCSEYRTSKVCGGPDCAGQLKYDWTLRGKNPTRKWPIHGRSRCTTCHTMWARDVTSGLSINKVWTHHCVHQHLLRPEAYRVQPRGRQCN